MLGANRWRRRRYLIKVLDKDVADARLAQGRVTLRPHDAARAPGDVREVHRVQGAFRVDDVVVVDVAVAEAAARDGIAADADRGDRADGVEDLEQQSFVDIRREIADVEGSGREVAGAGHGAAGRTTRHHLSRVHDDFYGLMLFSDFSGLTGFIGRARDSRRPTTHDKQPTSDDDDAESIVIR